MPLRVVLAEDNFLIREGTSALLEEVDDLEVVAAASDLPTLLDAVDKHKPDVVMTDIRMPPTQSREGIEAAKKIRAEYPAIGVLVLSQYADDEYAHALLKDGAGGLGYLLKERVSNIEEVALALKEVARGGTVLEPKIVEALLGRKDRIAASPIARLTEGERQVLEQMAQGKTNAAIAKTLFFSERSVEKHISGVFQKLDLSEEPEVHRRVMAVLTYLRDEGLVGAGASHDLDPAPVPRAGSQTDKGAGGRGETRVVKTFMFTDIVKSTNLAEAMGDEAWDDLIHWHDEMLRQMFAESKGEVVNSGGDGFFVAFEDPKSAIDAAVKIQKKLVEHRRSTGFSPPVRIGIHLAEATRKGKDYRGGGVHAAARIGDVAEGGEILASVEAIQAAGNAHPYKGEKEVQLKGISKPVKVALIDWK